MDYTIIQSTIHFDDVLQYIMACLMMHHGVSRVRASPVIIVKNTLPIVFPALNKETADIKINSGLHSAA